MFHPSIAQLNLWINPTCLFALIWPSLLHSFLNTPTLRLSISALQYEANGHEFTSRRCRKEHRKEGRADKRAMGIKKALEKNCGTPMYFTWPYIIHFEMHLGWCKSVQRHPPLRAFTLKCLCGWSVLRRFGPTSSPHPSALINHYGAELVLSGWSEMSNEHRDHATPHRPRNILLRFKHTQLRMDDRTGQPHTHTPDTHTSDLPASCLHPKTARPRPQQSRDAHVS